MFCILFINIMHDLKTYLNVFLDTEWTDERVDFTIKSLLPFRLVQIIFLTLIFFFF